VINTQSARSIGDLPAFPTLPASGYSEDFADLFSLNGSLLRSGSRRIVVFRHDDLRRMAAHPNAGNMPFDVLARRAFVDNPTQNPVTDDDRRSLFRILANQVFTANPPLHGPIRQVFARPLVPQRLPPFSVIADRLVAALIDEVAGQGEIDFSFQFTERLTARFWGTLLGMTGEEEESVVALVRAMTPFFFAERTREETIAVNAATGDYLELVAGAVHRSLSKGGNELLSAMAAEFDAVEIPGKPESIGMSIASNLIDGFHTAALSATNAVYQLLLHPEALEAVRADSNLVRRALAEGLRLSPPVILTNRYALDDFVFQETLIPQGTAIAMLWAAGNRDPAVFEGPSRYDLWRTQHGTTTFGGGIHICPGRNVAVMLGEAVLKGVIRPNISITLTGPVEWIARSTMRQPYRLPVAIHRA
jgi:cytochrome P450